MDLFQSQDQTRKDLFKNMEKAEHAPLAAPFAEGLAWGRIGGCHREIRK